MTTNPCAKRPPPCRRTAGSAATRTSTSRRQRPPAPAPEFGRPKETPPLIQVSRIGPSSAWGAGRHLGQSQHPSADTDLHLCHVVVQDLYGLQHRLRAHVGCHSDCCCGCTSQPPVHLPVGRRRLADRMALGDDCQVDLSATETEASGDLERGPSWLGGPIPLLSLITPRRSGTQQSSVSVPVTTTRRWERHKKRTESRAVEFSPMAGAGGERDLRAPLTVEADGGRGDNVESHLHRHAPQISLHHVDSLGRDRAAVQGCAYLVALG